MTTEAVGRQQEGVLAGDGTIYEVACPGPRSDREHLSRVLSGRRPHPPRQHGCPGGGKPPVTGEACEPRLKSLLVGYQGGD